MFLGVGPRIREKQQVYVWTNVRTWMMKYPSCKLRYHPKHWCWFRWSFLFEARPGYVVLHWHEWRSLAEKTPPALPGWSHFLGKFCFVSCFYHTKGVLNRFLFFGVKNSVTSALKKNFHTEIRMTVHDATVMIFTFIASKKNMADSQHLLNTILSHPTLGEGGGQKWKSTKHQSCRWHKQLPDFNFILMHGNPRLKFKGFKSLQQKNLWDIFWYRFLSVVV